MVSFCQPRTSPLSLQKETICLRCFIRSGFLLSNAGWFCFKIKFLIVYIQRPWSILQALCGSGWFVACRGASNNRDLAQDLKRLSRNSSVSKSNALKGEIGEANGDGKDGRGLERRTLGKKTAGWRERKRWRRRRSEKWMKNPSKALCRTPLCAEVGGKTCRSGSSGLSEKRLLARVYLWLCVLQSDVSSGLHVLAVQKEFELPSILRSKAVSDLLFIIYSPNFLQWIILVWNRETKWIPPKG